MLSAIAGTSGTGGMLGGAGEEGLGLSGVRGEYALHNDNEYQKILVKLKLTLKPTYIQNPRPRRKDIEAFYLPSLHPPHIRVTVRRKNHMKFT